MPEPLVRADALEFVAELEARVKPFTEDDDLEFWRVCLSILMRDAEYAIGDHAGGREFYIHVGACSHWRRPHQTRWTADGGFAWPSGYNGTRWSRTGLPQRYWIRFLHCQREEKSWRFKAILYRRSCCA